jgi:hypothetical protein
MSIQMIGKCAFSGILISILILCGCVQMPTEKQSVSDMRPQLTFKIINDNLINARISVDGLDMGIVGDYAEGLAALRVLPGTHVIRVNVEGQVVVDEKFYIGDGVTKSFLVK